VVRVLKFHRTIVLLTLVFAVIATIALATLSTMISAFAASTDKPLAPEMVYTAFFLWIIIPFLILKLVERIRER
jgi:hypothetical protein